MLFMRTYADHSWGIEKGFGGSLWVMDDFHGQMHEVITPKHQCHRISRAHFLLHTIRRGTFATRFGLCCRGSQFVVKGPQQEPFEVMTKDFEI